jgi:hypothetical protein
MSSKGRESMIRKSRATWPVLAAPCELDTPRDRNLSLNEQRVEVKRWPLDFVINRAASTHRAVRIFLRRSDTVNKCSRTMSDAGRSDMHEL